MVDARHTAMNSRVKRLDTPAEHLWRIGDGRDIPVAISDPRLCEAPSIYSLNVNSRLPDHPRSSTAAQQPEPELLEPLGEGQETILIIDGKQRCWVSLRPIPLFVVTYQ